MTTSDLIVVGTGVLIASACALLGVFLVLRRMAMMADAISHAILPGIVVGYWLAHGPDLLSGFLGAAAAGIICVAAVEALQSSRRVGGQAAIGIVFPAMFAFGTFLVSRFFADVHLDTDAVLYGNIEFAAQDYLVVGGTVFGPQPLYVMGAMLLMNLLFVGIFFKELKIATFDPGLAAALGFSPVAIHYALMTVMSITTVGAFSAVGAILVVALMIVPAATAYLLTDRLSTMIGLAVLAGALSAITGFVLAVALNASVAGAIASMTGVYFGLALLFSPLHGLVARARRLRRQQLRLAAESLVIHLANHEGDEAESAVAHLSEELRWSADFAQRAVRTAERQGLIERQGSHLILTASGRSAVRTLRST
ncbi:MAG: metal ABC transporter permease [Chloroflexi bacterium]|nr:metal ABC transporter permease [Chloroflexota bacterium]